VFTPELRPYMQHCPRCGYSPSGKSRSNPQNRYYWGCVVQILSDETGYTKDEVHDIIKRKFLTEKRLYQGGKPNFKLQELEFSKSTTELDTKEWENLMSQIREWASMELGIYIQNPGECKL
jgi:hypothetical protein